MYQNMHFWFQETSNKQQQKNKNQKKQKKSKKKREYLWKIDLKKICDRPGEDFFRQPHFRKQECYFFWSDKLSSSTTPRNFIRMTLLMSWLFVFNVGRWNFWNFWNEVIENLYDLVAFVQNKKRDNIHEGVILLVKLRACNFTKSITPPWVFFTSFKLCKWY